MDPTYLPLETRHGLAHIQSDRADFRDLRTTKGLYVDKTGYIVRMRHLRRKYLLLARPRRFGKSLLVSSLRYFFQGRCDLFAGTALAQELDEFAVYPVIHWTMTEVQGQNGPEVQEDLLALLQREYHYWQTQHIDLSPAQDGTIVHASSPKTPAAAFRHLLACLHQACGRPVVVLIDEYDAPITDLLGADGIQDSALALSAGSDMSGVLHALRQFYRVLKDREHNLHFVFITGISRFARVNLFSSLHNLTDISFHADFTGICGFTDAELDGVLAPYLELAARNARWPLPDLRGALQDQYSGYQFSPGTPPVYNPYSLLGCLSEMYESQADWKFHCRRLPAIWSESGNPDFLIRMMQSGDHDLNALFPDPQRALRATYDPMQPNLGALLVQTGYFTLKQETPDQEPRLDFANREVRDDFSQQLLDLYRIRYQVRYREDLDLMYRTLAQQDYRAFRQVVHRVFAGIPYDLLHNENACHAVLMALEYQIRLPAPAEVHVRGGRADMALRFPDHVCVVELKCNGSVEGALQQIRERGYADAEVGRGFPVIGVGLNFTHRDTAPVTEIGWETLYAPP